MELIAYYEGSDQTQEWLCSVLETRDITFKKLPTQNNSKDFTKLPAYVSDILYLDKPDIILSGSFDGEHEKPIFSIEFASCTPQYQHSLQRFSRMMASVVNSCPSILVLPAMKRENADGIRTYRRSRAVEYGAVRLMDIFRTPAFIFEWENDDGILKMEDTTGLPMINTNSISDLRSLLKQAIKEFHNIDYVGALWRLPIVKNLLDKARERAYIGGTPTISQPGGGDGGNSQSNLELLETSELINTIEAKSTSHRAQIKKISEFILEREKSLVFYPTRVTAHAGDPYVGMIGYYDIAFCRVGQTTRERNYNLVAFCNDVSIEEINSSMKEFNTNKCPFVQDMATSKLEKYSYHLKYGCKLTKSKPVRIYSELADLIIFNDGLIYNVG